MGEEGRRAGGRMKNLLQLHSYVALNTVPPIPVEKKNNLLLPGKRWVLEFNLSIL